MGLRRKSREIAIQSLYMYDIAETSMSDLLSFNWIEKKYNLKVLLYSTKLIKGSIDNIDNIDLEIKKAIENELSIKRMGIIEKAILRIAVYELLYEEIPDSIVLNEAIELSKKFGNEFSHKFVNGILDEIRRNKNSSYHNQ